MLRHRLTVALSCGALALVAACSGGPAAPVISTSPSATPTPSVSPSVEPSELWPLTGQPGPAGARVHPVVVVKVDNDPATRPQSGLEDADLVIEEVVEGGMTRFAAVYQSVMPEAVGPVRSIRHVDAALVSPMADALIYSGAAPAALKYVKGVLPKRIKLYSDGAKGTYRDPGRVAPRNLYVSLDTLVGRLKPRATPAVGLLTRTDDYSWGDIGALEPIAESAVSRLTLKFSAVETCTWSWSKNDKAWLRGEKGQPFVNPDGERIMVPNLVVLIVRMTKAGYTDGNGVSVPKTELSGSGKGYILVNGARMSITWSKKTPTSHITLTDGGGNTVNLPPGRTWIALVPKSGGKVGFK